ncbi:unnamed protein product [Hymenolepis diminuta]|uniref:Autophagy-related protein 16 domain-containing protein n=1 Tax=Hymenolepis diminuta TaxID=6216 RepID=A0A564XWK4_HYMDI|nr:unnamed protein product [Hymenolepis diminuta]
MRVVVEVGYINEILSRLSLRDEEENRGYSAIIENYTKLYDRFCETEEMRHSLLRDVIALNRQMDKRNSQVSAGGFKNSIDAREMQEKLIQLQSEVIELHRKNTKLQNDVQAKQTQIEIREQKTDELNMLLEEARKINFQCLEKIGELEAANNTLLDEQTATTLSMKQLERDKVELKREVSEYITQISHLQSEVEKLKNVESDLKLYFEKQMIQKGLLDAAGMPLSCDEKPSFRNAAVASSIPDHVTATIPMAEDVNCVRFSPTGMRIVYGGLDKRVWVAMVKNDKFEASVALGVCNAGVNAVDFDPEERMVLGASSDFVCRVYNLEDRRMPLNLTGHSDRVMAARFIGSGVNGHDIVTASMDRCIKFWSLEQRRCSQTVIQTSLCNDLAVCLTASTVVSGHFDKKIRFWDANSCQMARETTLSGRITGLDVSNDERYVVACTRSDSLYVVDFRRDEVLQSFQAENFKIHSDYVRPCFSPDGVYIACGSQSGDIFIWNRETCKLEKILHGHDNMVLCTSWSPKGDQMTSCERGKKIALWSHVG